MAFLGDLSVAKLTSYVVVGPSNLAISKITGYVVVGPSNLAIAKITGYAVLNIRARLQITQAGVEVWEGGGAPAIAVTQAGVETYFSMIPALVVTQFGRETWIDHSAAYSGGPTVDADFTNVVLLCHLNGTNGQTTTVDSSTSAHAMTPSGTTVLSTAQKRFGTASSDNTGGSAAQISSPDSADWAFGTGPFTVECFVRFSTNSGATMAMVSQLSALSFGWWLGMDDATHLRFYYSTTGADLPGITGVWSPSLNTWYHIAVDRDAGNTLRIYADGAVIASAAAAVTFVDSTAALSIGNDSRAIRQFTGFLDEVRITKGVARYGGGFTPPYAEFPGPAATSSAFTVVMG